MARSFNGSTDAYALADINKPRTTTYGLGGWVKPDASRSGSQVLFCYGLGTVGGTGTGFQIVLRTDGKIRWDSFSGATNFQSAGTTALTDSVWQHLMCVREGLFAHRIYLDGTLVDTLAIDAGAAQNATDDFFIGKPVVNDGSGFGKFTGSLAHVVYYDDAPTAAEVASIADKSTCPPSIVTHGGNLQVFVKMTSGASVVDDSANAFTVTADGSPGDVASPSGLPCDGGGASEILNPGQCPIFSYTNRIIGY